MVALCRLFFLGFVISLPLWAQAQASHLNDAEKAEVQHWIDWLKGIPAEVEKFHIDKSWDDWGNLVRRGCIFSAEGDIQVLKKEDVAAHRKWIRSISSTVKVAKDKTFRQEDGKLIPTTPDDELAKAVVEFYRLRIEQFEADFARGRDLRELYREWIYLLNGLMKNESAGSPTLLVSGDFSDLRTRLIRNVGKPLHDKLGLGYFNQK